MLQAAGQLVGPVWPRRHEVATAICVLFTRILTALLTHLTERTARVTDLTTSICAVLTAEACNTGPEPFIRYDNPALRRDRLAWVKHRKSSWPTCIFRVNERFLYEYDFCDLWQHQVRIEKRLEVETSRSYPVCVGGQWAGHRRIAGDRKRFWIGARPRRGESESCLMIYWKASKLGILKLSITARGAAALARVAHAASL